MSGSQHRYDQLMVQRVQSASDTDNAIKQMVEIIVDGWDPVQVILFGSRARGDHREDSDADLLVVLDEVDDYGGLRLAIDTALDCTRMRRDIKLATPTDVVRMATVAGTIERAAMVEGRTLHVRGRGDPVTETVLRWLEMARRDLRGGRILLAADPTEPALACFHAQQAAEKSLKAALVAEGIDPPRSHDLTKLRDLLPETWETPGTTADLSRISPWAEKSRYSNDFEDFTDPTATWGISVAQAMYDAVVSGLTRRGVMVE
jgi:HEPN domain-containing protein/predicted nucleotidyltransferase